MQYLSQRLASKPAPRRDEGPPGGPLAARQRGRILDAVEALVAERGCTGASIEAIVKAAGVSSVTFYEHFAGKEASYVAAFERAVEEAVEALRAAAPENPTWPESVASGVRGLLGEVEAQPARARLCLVEAQMGGPQLSARFQATLDRVAAKLREGRSLETAPPGLPESLEEATAGGLAWMLRERLERSGGGGGADGAGAAGGVSGVADLYPKLIEIGLAPYLGDG